MSVSEARYPYTIGSAWSMGRVERVEDALLPRALGPREAEPKWALSPYEATYHVRFPFG